MRTTTRILLLMIPLFLVTAVPTRAGLAVEAYIELTIARLELVESALRESGGPPTEEELDELYAAHGTDREEYFCYSGGQRRRVEAYLRNHPELRDQIESLSASIRREVANKEPD